MEKLPEAESIDTVTRRGEAKTLKSFGNAYVTEGLLPQNEREDYVGRLACSRR